MLLGGGGRRVCGGGGLRGVLHGPGQGSAVLQCFAAMRHGAHLLLLLLAVAMLGALGQGQGQGQGSSGGDQETDSSIEAAGVSVNVRGQSGKMTLTIPGADLANPNVVECQMVALRQLDESGNTLGAGGADKQSFNSFATQTFSFSDPLETTYEGLRVSEIEFQSVLGGGSRVNIRTMIFLESGTIAVGDDTFQVTQGAVKFNVELSEWSWCGDQGVSCTNADGVGDAVELDLDMYARGNTPEMKAEGAASSTYELGGGPELVLLSTFSADGGAQWREMPSGYPAVDGSVFTLRFPRWDAGQSVLYDPIIQYSTGQVAQGGDCTPLATDPAQSCEAGTRCDESTNKCVADCEQYGSTECSGSCV
eukprot:COSAG02_NODE_10779_length_1859_cov_3.213068_3_plen_363_part_01